MKFLRHGLVRKVLCSFFLFLILQSVIAPTCVLALTTGPHQPEYISFASPGRTDMVDLATGDLALNLPVLDVPGPEGNFSVPLAYNAGIGLEQEASWVGLGFSLNCGALTRTINEYPDDASGESHTITVKDVTGLKGWNASVLGIGKMGWNNQTGHSGSISILSIINAEWTDNHSSVGIAGFNVTDDGLKTNTIQTGLAVVTIATWGAGSMVGEGASMMFSGGQLAKQIAINSISTVAMDGAMSLANNNSIGGNSSGGWQYSKSVKKNWGLKILSGFTANVKEYKVWLDKTRNEKMYGLLYLGNVPTVPALSDGQYATTSLRVQGSTQALTSFSAANNEGAASDMNFQTHPNDDLKEFHEINNPSALAQDNFSVKASGITGTIRPYRLDIGSVAMPRAMTSTHERLSPVKFLANDANYKVPFIYDGQPSNAYFHHVGGAASVTSPLFYYGLTTTTGTTDPLTNTSVTYTLNDVVFKSQRIAPTINSNKKIEQSNYVEWLSNDEIRNAITYASKYMDYFSGGASVNSTSERYQFRTSLPFGKMSSYTFTSSLSGTLPISATDISKFSVGDVIDLDISIYNDGSAAAEGKTNDYRQFLNVIVTAVSASSITVNDSRLVPYYGKYANVDITIHKSPQSLASIGGFCITAPDGTTYHFALPAYDYDQYTEFRKVTDPNNVKSTVKRTAPFANTWLLTGITGSDFVDRNSNGVIDETDWGHWVKFHYNNYMNDFKWRTPFSGYRQIPDGTYETFTEGNKQLYYLNGIETRSHIAIFLKSSRQDGKSASSTSQYPLKLDEIILLTKERFTKLITPTASGGLGLTDFRHRTNVSLLSSSIDTNMRTHINSNCSKRILFSYAYNLAQGTTNSTASGAGKLTLTRLSVLGTSSKKIVPDYLFEYSNNPTYNANHWDGWGMYNPSGSEMGGTHLASTNSSHGAAWSLTKVTTPLGAEININYERDSYSSVSGMTFNNYGPSFSNLNFNLFVHPVTRLTISNPSSYFEVGDIVRVSGYVTYTCPNTTVSTNKTYNFDAPVTGIGTDYIDFGYDYMALGCSAPNSGQVTHFDAQVGQIYLPFKNKLGGDIRVASIVVKDEFQNENKLRYIYKNTDGTSSGVISKLPNYISGPYFSFNDYIGYPQTPILYGRVTVLGGKLTTDQDFVSKQVYEFETPHYSQYQLSQSIIKDKELIREANVNNLVLKDYLTLYWNRFEDRTSAIGRIKSVQVYDKAGSVYSSSTFTYTDQYLNNGVNNYQGYYSDGVIMFDRVWYGKDRYHKINRTSFLQYPSVLKKITSYKDGFTAKSENLNWDFITGGVLEKVENGPLGLSIKTVAKPAYTIYPELATKAANPANKHMLTQEAAKYVYRSDALGNALGLLEANVQLWNKTWSNYRVYNSSTLSFSDAVEGDDVWRKGASYAYIGNYSKLKNGVMMFDLANDDFNFSNPTLSTLWKYVGEPKRYDHYSMPLEGTDMNRRSASLKMGYNNKQVIASASNAGYNEFAFSSAEDLESDKPFFGGEVGLGNGTVLYRSKGQITQANTGVTNITEPHSGDALLVLTAGKGFVYKATDVKQNRVYRASVWTNSYNGKINYRINSGSPKMPQMNAIGKSGPWILQTVDIPIGAGVTSLEIYVYRSQGTEKILFDDFRFQPVDAEMTCYVPYAPSVSPNLQYSYVLDNDNLLTKYQYDQRGYLTAVFRESIRPEAEYNGLKQVATYETDFRRYNFNQ